MKIRIAVATVAAALAVCCASALSAQVALPPTSPRFQEIARLAQEGYGDSARTLIAGVISRTAPADPAYAEALYTAGTVARTGDEMRTWFRRVVVEYPTSAWADKAQLRLAQLAFGNGDMSDVVIRVSRLFADYPDSPVIPTAALWGARAAFEQQKMQLACDWLTRGIAAAGDDLELRNQLQFTKQRCNVGDGVRLSPPVAESLRAGPPPQTPVDTPAQRPPSATPPVKPAGGTTASPWRIQVAAIADQVVIRRLIQKIEAAGFTAYRVPGPRGLTKVQAGPFASRAAAAAKLARLKSAVSGSAFVTATP